MVELLSLAIIIMLAILYIMLLLSWINTLKIMDQQSSRLSLLGFFFAPIPQLIFCISHKETLSAEQKKIFTRYWVLTCIAFIVFVVGIIYVISLPNDFNDY